MQWNYQVLKGSHKLGRIEHKRVAEQIGADMERVEQVMKVRAITSYVECIKCY